MSRMKWKVMINSEYSGESFSDEYSGIWHYNYEDAVAEAKKAQKELRRRDPHFRFCFLREFLDVL